MNKKETRLNKPQNSREEYLTNHDDPLIQFLHKLIRVTVRVLSVLMVFVILWGIGDVVYTIYKKVNEPPFFLLDINNILATFGAFLAVLQINISSILSRSIWCR